MLIVLGSPPEHASPGGLWQANGIVATPPAFNQARRGVLGALIECRSPPNWTHLALLGGQEDDHPPSMLRDAGRILAEDLEAGVCLIVEAEPITKRLEVRPRPAIGELVQCLVFSNPVPGSEREFNIWYSQQHLYDVLQVPGYQSAQRYALGRQRNKPELSWRYMALYEVVAEAYEAAMAEVARRSGTIAMPISSAAGRPTSAHFRPFAWWGEPER